MSSRQAEKDRLRQERLAREEAERRAAGRRRRLQLAGGAAALAAIVAVLVVVVAAGGGGHSTSSSTAPAASRLLASTNGEAGGQAVDGIRCQSHEQAIFHIHAHLAVYVNGRPRAIPEGIGIPPPRTVEQTTVGPFVASGSCFYWLHSHTRDGIVHIEAPVRRVFTLGNYFDIWKQPVAADRVGSATGRVVAYVDGRRYKGIPARFRSRRTT